MSRLRLRYAGVAALAYLASAAPAHAHAFAQRYDLPIPLWLYVTGAGATVAVSFIIVGIFVRRERKGDDVPRLELLDTPVGRVIAHRYALSLLRLLSVGIFIVLILAGLFGVQDDPDKNILPTAVWVIWWVGLAFFSALMGDLWSLLNPWRIVAEWVAGASARLRPATPPKRRELPAHASVWPAVFVFVVFAWAELVWPNRAIPASLSVAVILYSIATWIGMYFVGIEAWLRRGEAFSILYGLFARFARIELRVTTPAHCKTCDNAVCQGNKSKGCRDCATCFRRARPEERRIDLRPYGVGLLTKVVPSVSIMAFVLLVLSTVSFDGFADTPAWRAIFDAALAVPFISALPNALGLTNASGIITTVGIVLTPLIFFGFYMTICAIIAALTRGAGPGELAGAPQQWSALSIGRVFIFTLVPIAIAYHLAHFLSLFLIFGQAIIPLASDPFGYGWNLFGTADYQVDIAIVGARFAWIAAVIAIVVGHIVAVYLAHVMALRAFGDRAIALRSQYPMLVLMVGYTMISLWILAQPIVEA
jgi:hypothetical protein